jgi:formylglycine-generating enzyme required for sulfatase activity
VKYFKTVLAVMFAFMFISAEKNFITRGKVESVRNDGYLTVILDSEITESEYLLLNDNIIIGKIHTFRLLGYAGDKPRYQVRFEYTGEKVDSLLKAGIEIIIKPETKNKDKSTEKSVFLQKPVYKTAIVSQVDRREMILIPGGKFFMGSNNGDEDEFPEHVVNLTEYYIDRFEVSNEDYKIYADSKAIPYPAYWSGKITSGNGFNDLFFSRLPVVVSYYEAEGYARWCGKRLPDEMEWEKAARFPPSPGKGDTWSDYTWGNNFKEGVSNTEEFWASDETGLNLKTMIKEKYRLAVLTRGLIPVDMYETTAVSNYGIVHMDGNVSEWTSSWYQGYEMTRKKNIKYGTQYKVIKGGSYNLGRNEARVTDRKIGGIPDLYRDRIAGIRCVKDVSDNDRIKESGSGSNL